MNCCSIDIIHQKGRASSCTKAAAGGGSTKVGCVEQGGIGRSGALYVMVVVTNRRKSENLVLLEYHYEMKSMN